MKRIIIALSIISLLWVSCQEVITVELPKQEPKLIVDALVRIDTLESTTLVTVEIYSELRNSLATEKFGVTYDYLVEVNDKPKISAIRDIYPQRISEAEPKNVGGQ